ncbi:Hsp70 family protein [Rhodococcus sp. MTM3W5.2]|uniref:Hsp70 family protein n=1 Tax=Rhodococcus sp. MTM3W5.2 TaxID=1805827 RepID=UPI001CB932FB|nr:Hsp70 family protein [Rhodococcus sp. MTM3W5.2]
MLATERSTEIAGDYFDWLISEHQAGAQGIVSPVGADEATAFNERCRFAKEQLSASEAIAVPSEAGLILLSRETFESMIVVPVEGSARFARGVIAASGRYPDAVILLGGGAHIPLVQSILRTWLNLPTVVPAEPEMVTAQGAAMLATPVSVPEPQWVATDAPSLRRTRGPSRRQLAIAGAAATGLVVVAGIGLSMGRDGAPTTQGEGRATAVTEDRETPSTTSAPPTTTTTPPSSTPSRAPALPPAAESSPANPAPPPAPGPPPRRYLNLPDPIQIEVPPGVELPPGLVR